jgi:hypothetical protein
MHSASQKTHVAAVPELLPFIEALNLVRDIVSAHVVDAANMSGAAMHIAVVPAGPAVIFVMFIMMDIFCPVM